MAEENNVIYFDHAATTLPLKEVGPLFVGTINSHFANPASVHLLGMENARLLDKARNEILYYLNMKDHQVIFTSGATESNNLALKGYMERYKGRGKHLIISMIEHPSVMNVATYLKDNGFDVSIIPVDEKGIINLEALEKSIRSDTTLISIMGVNNEVGSVEPIKEIVEILKKHPQVKLHVDAVQAVGKVDLPYNDIDLLTISLHKLGGLKGSGLLIKRKSLELIPILNGGGQEYGLRSGTNDLANAVVASFVIKTTLKEVEQKRKEMKELVKPLYDYFESRKDEVIINSSLDNPYILNISLLHKKASVFAEYLSNYGIMVSTHSACSSKLDIGSPTLLAMGRNSNLAKNSIRLSFALSNTKEEIARFINMFDSGLKRIRG